MEYKRQMTELKLKKKKKKKKNEINKEPYKIYKNVTLQNSTC
jgi:hypothetical protein